MFRRVVLMLVVAGPMLLATAAAYGQKAAPQPALTRSPSPLIGYFLIFVFLCAIVAISLMPSKRTHLD